MFPHNPARQVTRDSSPVEPEVDTVQTLLHHEVAAAAAAELAGAAAAAELAEAALGEPAVGELSGADMSAAEVLVADELAAAADDGAGFPETAVDVEELISGLIAAHDLASIPGSTAIQVQLERTLRAAGLTRIQVTTGQPFDPNEQMVAAVEPAPAEEQDRCVAREIRSGWKRRDLVVRPAEVVVWTAS